MLTCCSCFGFDCPCRRGFCQRLIHRWQPYKCTS
ncbi:hypothetical protein Gogos_002671 [Gossypium gossypioides]|uniref:Uncharacterized protein n=1 Tax=Gossypium gossypioides TaxID=34282 RepID=A0A7J9CJM3_GOSGO|nr:hypothetical protein [Gossypium gossypioides]